MMIPSVRQEKGYERGGSETRGGERTKPQQLVAQQVLGFWDFPPVVPFEVPTRRRNNNTTGVDIVDKQAVQLKANNVDARPFLSSVGPAKAPGRKTFIRTSF